MPNLRNWTLPVLGLVLLACGIVLVLDGRREVRTVATPTPPGEVATAAGPASDDPLDTQPILPRYGLATAYVVEVEPDAKSWNDIDLDDPPPDVFRVDESGSRWVKVIWAGQSAPVKPVAPPDPRAGDRFPFVQPLRDVDQGIQRDW